MPGRTSEGVAFGYAYALVVMLREMPAIMVSWAGCRQEYWKVAVLDGVQHRRRLRRAAGRRRCGKLGQQEAGWLRERWSRTGRMCWAKTLEGTRPA